METYAYTNKTNTIIIMKANKKTKNISASKKTKTKFNSFHPLFFFFSPSLSLSFYLM